MSSHRDSDIKYMGCVLQDDGSYLDKNGGIRWYNEEGDFHNDNGPMSIFADGNLVWALDGKLLTFAMWLERVNKTEAEKMWYWLRYSRNN
tara:strand:- start:322 stop:591 length:270 start_codon:yes stop_codon:yes gene_type:complete